MNAIDLLKNDHDYVDQLFGQIEATPPSRHPAIFKRIKNELDTHAHIEEKIFYPTILKGGDKELKDITNEGIQEHTQIKKFLKEIARTTSKETREAKLKVLIEDTRHHVKEEENEMFPMVEDQFSSEELERLGERMDAEKKKFQKAKRIPARRVQPKSTLTKIVEKAEAVIASVLGSDEPDSRKPKANRSKPGNGSLKTGSSRKTGKSTTSKSRTRAAGAH